MKKILWLVPVLAAAAALSAAAAPVDDVVATVNGNSILLSDYKKELGGVLDQYDHTDPDAVKDPDKLSKIKQQVLDDMIDKELLREQADSMKIKIYSRELDNGVKEVKERFRHADDGTVLSDDQLETAFANELKKQGLSYEQFEDHVKRDLMIRKYVNENLRPEVKTPSDDEVKAYFKKVKYAVDGDTAALAGLSDEELGEIMTLARQLRELTAERIRVRHILIRVDRNASASERAAALAKIQDIKKQLDAGADFETLARKYSQDQGSAARGGDLGYLVKGMTVPEFEKAAFALDVGQTSDIVETPFGYHIIRVDEKRAARKLEYADVKDDLAQFMTGQELQRLVEAKVKELRAVASIQTFLDQAGADVPAASAGSARVP